MAGLLCLMNRHHCVCGPGEPRLTVTKQPPYFADEKTESLKGSAAFPRSPGNGAAEPGEGGSCERPRGSRHGAGVRSSTPAWPQPLTAFALVSSLQDGTDTTPLEGLCGRISCHSKVLKSTPQVPNHDSPWISTPQLACLPARCKLHEDRVHVCVSV